MATFENWGDYFWEGQIDECRRNLLGIHDPTELERTERKRTLRRAAELGQGIVAVPLTYDLAHVRAIHAHLFQDIYEWAGQLRVVDLVRPSVDPNAPGRQFVPPEQIELLGGQVFAQLGDPDAITALAARPLGERVERPAQTSAGLNVLHPFVEGNGRTQRIFLQDLAGAAGCSIDWTQMPQQNQVMAEAFTTGLPTRRAGPHAVRQRPRRLHLHPDDRHRPHRPDPRPTRVSPPGYPRALRPVHGKSDRPPTQSPPRLHHRPERRQRRLPAVAVQREDPEPGETKLPPDQGRLQVRSWIRLLFRAGGCVGHRGREPTSRADRGAPTTAGCATGAASRLAAVVA